MFSPDFIIIALMPLGVAWNLVLLAIPCLLAHEIPLWLKGRRWGALTRSDRLHFLAAFLLWLFFFPNTAYMFTLVRHLVAQCSDYNIHNVCREETWQAPVFFLYALTGLPAFVYSLAKMSRVIGRALPLVIIPFTAVGILFGLWDRLNTWDIVAHPLLVLQRTIEYFAQPIGFLNWLVYTAVLFILYYSALYLWNQKRP